MATLGREPRDSISIYNYPEHLNPFSEEDNVGKLHFYNPVPEVRKKTRSNSFSLSGFKDLRSTWSFKSFTKKGRRELKAKAEEKNSSSTNTSPIVFRKSINNNTSVQTLTRESTGGKAPTNRYVYAGSVTPLPRSRANERGTLSHAPSDYHLSPANQSRRTSAPGGSQPLPSLNELNVALHQSGSQSSLQSTLTLDNSSGSIRASSRKKRRAPPPPPRIETIPDTPQIVVTDTTQATTLYELPRSDDIDIDDPSFNIELKIVEDIEDHTSKENDPAIKEVDEKISVEITNVITPEKISTENTVEIDSVAEIVVEEPVVLKVSDACEITSMECKEDTVSQENDSDAETLHKDEINDCTADDVKFVLQTIALEEKPIDVFHKVDIVQYKKQQSLDVPEPTEASEDDKNDEDNLTNNNVIVEEKIITNSDPEIQIVKCKVIDSQEKYTVNNNLAARTEFFGEFFEATKDDATIREKEVENNNKPIYQRRTVSDMKMMFDNPKTTEWTTSPVYALNSPNPIPKPRRLRIGSKNSSTNELDNQLESPSVDNEDKLTLNL